MDFIIDAIVEWLKGLLVDGIMGNLDGLFDNVNQSVGEIATQVGTTPADWNAGVFSMIRQISETAILPIAGVILTFVMTYELIQMLIERNNLHEVDTWMFFKWVFKTFVAVMILTNTLNIVLAVFDVSQHVIQQSAGIKGFIPNLNSVTDFPCAVLIGCCQNKIAVPKNFGQITPPFQSTVFFQTL